MSWRQRADIMHSKFGRLIAHIGSLIAVKYYYFSHFRWLTNCLSTAPVGPCQFPIYCVLSMFTNPFLSFSFSFFGTFFYFIFIFIILPLAPVSSRLIITFWTHSAKGVPGRKSRTGTWLVSPVMGSEKKRTLPSLHWNFASKHRIWVHQNILPYLHTARQVV